MIANSHLIRREPHSSEAINIGVGLTLDITLSSRPSSYAATDVL